MHKFYLVLFFMGAASTGYAQNCQKMSQQFALNGTSEITTDAKMISGLAAASIGECQPLFMQCTAYIWSKVVDATDGRIISEGVGTQGCRIYNSVTEGQGTEGHGYCDNGLASVDGAYVTVSQLKADLTTKAYADNQPTSLGLVSSRLQDLVCSAESRFTVPVPAITQGIGSKDECGGVGSAQRGSIIGCRDQSLSQRIPLAGTPFDLTYNSLRINESKRGAKTVSFSVPYWNHPYTGENQWRLIGASALLSVAGKVYSGQVSTPVFADGSHWNFSFTWDGKDSQGNDVDGPVTGEVNVTWKYAAGWTGTVSTLTRSSKVRLQSANPTDQKLGGWSLSEYHRFDKSSGSVFLGNGQTIKDESKGLNAIQLDSSGYYNVPSNDGSLIYRFDSQQKHVATLDLLSGIALYSFQHTNGLLSSITDRDGLVTTIQRNGLGQISAIASPYGVTTQLAYDSRGNLKDITNPLGFINHFEYYQTLAMDGLMSSMTDPLGKTKSYNFSSTGRLIEAIDAKGGHKTITASVDQGYDHYTDLATFTSPMGYVTRYETKIEYDGSKTSTNIFPSGYSVKERRYEDFSRIDTMDALGSSQSMQLGKHPLFPNRLVPTSESEGNLGGYVNYSQTFTRGASGNLLDVAIYDAVTEISGRGSYKTSYNKTKKILYLTTPMNRKSRILYDSKGHITREELPGVAPVDYQYNASGQLIAVTQGSRVYAMTYDAKGFLAQVKDPLGQITQYAYDAAGQLTALTLANGKRYEYQRNGNGDLISLKTSANDTYAFGFDNNRNLTLHTEPMLASESYNWVYVYDADDKISSVTRPGNTQVALAYDANSNLVSATGPGLNRSYTWNQGALQEISAESGINLSLSTRPFPERTAWSGALNAEIGYVWGPHGQLNAMSVNGAETIDYAYDADGALIKADQLTYNRNATTGLVESTTLGQVQTTQTYDAYGAPAETIVYSRGAEIYRIRYTRDALGRVTRIDENRWGSALVMQYGYDSVGQLISETGPVGDATYSYTANGNRIDSTSPIYDAQDRLVSDGLWTYTYNKAGHLEQRTRKVRPATGTHAVTYSYNALGSLLSANREYMAKTSVKKGTTAPPSFSLATYAYDGANRRMISQNTVENWGTRLIYQDGLRPVAELNADGSVKSVFVYGNQLNVPEVLIQNSVRYRIIADQLGSPVVIISEAGDIVWSAQYSAWGLTTFVLAGEGLINPPFGFAGGIKNGDGTLRFGARDYDPTLGRWLTKDPIRFEGGFNLYVYSNNDPVNFFDFNGLEPITAAEGQKIADEARKWAAKKVPYLKGGKTDAAADCSGSTWAIYKDAGFDYGYSPTATFANNPKFKLAPKDLQVGDVGLYPDHMVIYDPNAGGNFTVWSATTSKGYRASDPGWFPGKLVWYRYEK